MKLNILVDDITRAIEVPEQVLTEGEVFFQKMDRDMDRGWQMSREFVERPNTVQRCQIAADRLLASLSAGNAATTLLMAGYILKRSPGVIAVDIDTHGDMLHTELIFTKPSSDTMRFSADVAPVNAGPMPPSLTKLEALDQAGREISKVYRVGKVYRYAVLNRNTGVRTESAPYETESQAEEQRLHEFKRRLDELMSNAR